MAILDEEEEEEISSEAEDMESIQKNLEMTAATLASVDAKSYYKEFLPFRDAVMKADKAGYHELLGELKQKADVCKILAELSHRNAIKHQVKELVEKYFPKADCRSWKHPMVGTMPKVDGSWKGAMIGTIDKWDGDIQLTLRAGMLSKVSEKPELQEVNKSSSSVQASRRREFEAQDKSQKRGADLASENASLKERLAQAEAALAKEKESQKSIAQSEKQPSRSSVLLPCVREEPSPPTLPSHLKKRLSSPAEGSTVVGGSKEVQSQGETIDAQKLTQRSRKIIDSRRSLKSFAWRLIGLTVLMFMLHLVVFRFFGYFL